MPNRTFIDAFERHNMRTGTLDYMVHMYDEFNEVTLIFAEKSSVPDDDLELLTEMIRAKNDEGIHGTDCYDIVELLDYVEEHEMPVTIGGTYYPWEKIKEIMKYDFRNLYACTQCGWESYDDDSHDCGRCKRIMQFVKQEEYEK